MTLILIRSEVSIGAEWHLDPAYITVCLVFTNQHMSTEIRGAADLCASLHTAYEFPQQWRQLVTKVYFMHLFSYLLMFTVCARVVIRLKRSLQDVSNEVCYQFMVSLILPVFASFCHGFYRFFHCPGKNSFCHGKNPTLRLWKVK